MLMPIPILFLLLPGILFRDEILATMPRMPCRVSAACVALFYLLSREWG
jgi:hypothetical protein